MTNEPDGSCTIFRGHGDPIVQPLELEPVEDGRHYGRRTLADRVPLLQIMSRDLICVHPDLEIGTVARLMIEHRIGCLPVVDSRRRPVGTITKFDIVEQLETFLLSIGNGTPLPVELFARTAEEVMMPLALTLDEHATVAHAASMMTCEDLHHILVVSTEGTLIGVVSSKDIVTWLVDNDDLVPRRSRAPRGSQSDFAPSIVK